ncbi:MAG: hypothetical protein II913_02845 [Elusimicrobiaceae bacterium]|nr:hypothetical protein [Elusimicrobiaceae bacterium]
MKKVLLGAIVMLLVGCYTPMNNSGVATTKPWIEIPGKRVDFDGKQYDSCVRLNLRFWPQEAAERLDLQESCITACCWRSEKDEIVLDFNAKFDEEMEKYGHARKYSPDKITFKVTHSNLVNVTKVKANPQKAVNNSGLIKLSYKEVRDEQRMAQLAKQREYRVQQIYQYDEDPLMQEAVVTPAQTQVRPAAKNPRPVTLTPPTTQPQTQAGETLVKSILQQRVGAKIDNYFYQMNKTYRQQGALFLLSSRILSAHMQEDGTYLVTCHAKARTGIDQDHLNASDFQCGVWLVDLSTQTVLPYDKKAKQINE